MLFFLIIQHSIRLSNTQYLPTALLIRTVNTYL